MMLKCQGHKASPCISTMFKLFAISRAIYFKDIYLHQTSKTKQNTDKQKYLKKNIFSKRATNLLSAETVQYVINKVTSV